MNALRQLEWALLELQQSTPLASVSGAISEIASTHFRVSGLSRFVRLGELIGVNSGGNALGQGHRANAVIGRALRLVLQNVGGARPGRSAAGTHHHG